MMNLVEIVAAGAGEKIIKKTKNRKLKYKYNWQNAFRFLINNLCQFSISFEYLFSSENC